MLRWKDLETTVGTSFMDLVQEIKRGSCEHRKVRCRVEGVFVWWVEGWRTSFGRAIQMQIDDCSCIIGCEWYWYLYNIYTTSILIRNRRAKQKHIMGLKQSSTSTLNPFYACQMLKSMPQWLRWSNITFRVASIFSTRASTPKNSCITSPNGDLRNPHPSRGGVWCTTWR